MQEYFLTELDKIDLISDPMSRPISSREILFWLNEAVNKFIKTRYGDNNLKLDSYEETQKRIDDLRKLVRDTTLYTGLTITGITAATPNGVVTVSNLRDLQDGDTVLIRNVSGMVEVNDTEHTVSDISTGAKTFKIGNTDGCTAYDSGGYAYRLFDRDNTYKVILPDNYWFATREQVKFDYTSLGSTIYSNIIKGVIKTTDDRYEFALQDPYSEHILHYEDAKPLRSFIGNNVELTTDGNYYVREYLLKYIKKPVRIMLSDTLIAAGANALEIGATYVVTAAGDDIVHPTGGTSYSAGDEFIAIANDFTTILAGTVDVVGDCDLAEHTHNEIVKIASALYLESVSDPQLQTKEVEISKME